MIGPLFGVMIIHFTDCFDTLSMKSEILITGINYQELMEIISVPSEGRDNPEHDN